MKKIVKSLLVTIITLSIIFTAVSCGNDKDDELNKIKEVENTLTTKQTELTNQLESLKTSYETSLKELQDKDTENKDAINSLKTEYENKVKDLETKDTENSAALLTLKSNYEEELAKLQVEDTENKDAINSLKTEYENKVKDLETKDAENSAALSNLKSSYETSLKELQDKDIELSQSITNLTNDYNTKIEELKSSYNTKFSEIESTLTLLKSTNSDYSTKINELSDKLTELSNTVNSLLIVKICTITFITNSDTVIPSQEVIKGEKITKPVDPEKENHEFLGWYIDDEKWIFNGYVVTENITLEAKWKAPYSFNLNNSIKESNTYKVEVSNDTTSYNFKSNISVESYKTYYLSKDENGTTISLNKTVNLEIGNNIYYILCEKENEEIDTFKVNIYRKNKYKVTFNTDSTNVINPIYVEENDFITGITNPTKTGYTFTSWDYDFTNPVTSDLTINAIWNLNTYQITYVLNGGSNNKYNPSSYYYTSETIVLKNASKTETVFNGWYKDELFTEKIEKIEKGSTGDLTLYAKFTMNQYTLTFNTNGGTTIAPITADYGTIVNVVTTKDNCIFEGWYKDEEFNTIYELSTIPNEDLTLYARWVKELEVFEISGTKYIYFGEYPQTLKEDSVTITSDTPDKNGYYPGSDGMRYAKVEATPCSYDKMYFNNKTIINSGTTYYFKVEPIKWQILESNDGTYKLVSNLIIDNQKFNETTDTRSIDGETIYSNNYGYSDIREWLNDEFLNQAFTTELQNYINTTHVDNSLSSTGYESNPYVCSDTNDKVYLLSYSEITNTNYGYSSDLLRKKQLTDYAKAKGCYMNKFNYGSYWLRSPYNVYDGCTRNVDIAGDVSEFSWVHSDTVGVVVAITITI